MTISSYMSHVTSDFLTASRDSHGITVKADIYYGGAFVDSVPLVSGTVNVDRTADNARSGSAVVGDPAFSPLFVNSPLAPYGAELKIYHGTVFDGGATTWIPLGVFTLNETDQEDSTGDLPEIVFFDRSKVIQRANFRGVGNFAGEDVRHCITRLIQGPFPAGLQQPSVIFDPALGVTTQKIPGGTVFSLGEGSRWQAIQTLCSWLGAEGRFGYDGNFYVMPVPTLIGVSSPVPVWTFDAKQGTDQDPNGVLVQARRGVTREGCYNFVSVQGATNSKGASPIGWAFDSDPRSPTYWGATVGAGDTPGTVQPFGPTVLPLVNDQLLTTAQCNAYAAAQLSNVLGLARSLTFTAVLMPALEAGDIVKAVYKSGAYEYHLMDSFSIPLGTEGQFTGTTRTQTWQLSAGT